MFPINAIKPKEMAEILNTNVPNLHYLDNIGVIPAQRTDTNRRYYALEDVKLAKYIYDQRMKIINGN